MKLFNIYVKMHILLSQTLDIQAAALSFLAVKKDGKTEHIYTQQFIFYLFFFNKLYLCYSTFSFSNTIFCSASFYL